MYNISMPLRSAVMHRLRNNILYSGVKVPIWENFAQETEAYKIAVIEKYDLPVEMYVLMLNQNEQPDNTKCDGKEASFQLQINTLWPSDSGTGEEAESIETIIYNLLVHDVSKRILIDLGVNFYIWKLEIVQAKSMMYDDNDKRVWTRQITFQASINRR